MRQVSKGFPIQIAHTPLRVGKYVVLPSTRLTDAGHYAASVSIRSGRGAMSHDRVMRFVPGFDTPQKASRFAVQQALAWIDDRVADPAFCAKARDVLASTASHWGLAASEA